MKRCKTLLSVVCAQQVAFTTVLTDPPNMVSLPSAVEKHMSTACAYAKGAFNGTHRYFQDTFFEIIQIVLHPVDSAVNLYSIVVHYDETFQIIQKHFLDIKENYSSYSPEEQASFVAYVGWQVAFVFVPIGPAVKYAGGLQKWAPIEKMLKSVSTYKVQLAQNPFILKINTSFAQNPVGRPVVSVAEWANDPLFAK
jgi:hypothetical protein